MQRKRIIIGVMVIMVAIALIVGGVLLAVNLQPKEYDKVIISNSEAISDISREEYNAFKVQLLQLLVNRGLLSGDATLDDVVVRDNTVVRQSTANGSNYTKWTSFLVDIDSLKQTYRANIYDTTYEMDNSPVQISCPMVSEMKYPEEKCVGVYGDDSNSVALRLPYTFQLESGEKVLVKGIRYINGRANIMIYLYSCENSNPPANEAGESTKEWARNLGDSAADNYIYNVRTGYCDGDAI